MIISNPIPALAAIIALAASLPAQSDVVHMADGKSHLTGEVLAMHQDHRIELNSPLSPEPLQINGDRLWKILFTESPGTSEPAPMKLTLRNHDTLPITAIEGMSDGHILAHSPVTGPLKIPVAAISTAQFGVSPNRVIYSGVNQLDEWADEMDERENWRFSSKQLLASGTAVASKDFDLPADFILSLKLEWTLKSPPDIRIDFADSNPAKNGISDRYRLAFNVAGIRLERECLEDKSRHTLGQLRRTPAQYADEEIHLRIHVQRSARRLALFINGEPEGVFADPIGSTPPPGSAVTLNCQTRIGGLQKISRIKVEELHHTHDLDLGKIPTDPSADLLITRDDDRMTGRLTAIQSTPNGNQFLFQSTLRKSPLQIPQKEVSAIRFAAADNADNHTPEPSAWSLEITHQGRLQVDSCRLNQHMIQVKHPLLGMLDIQKNGVKSIARNQSGAITPDAETP